MTTFTFDNDYRNLTQIRPFYPAFVARYLALEAEGRYPYNSLFVGQLGITDGDEDTAIYLCQGLNHLHETALQVNAFVDAGGVFYTPDVKVPGPRCTVAQFGWYMGDTGFRVIKDVRLVFRQGATRPFALLPKGKRTNGYAVEPGAVLLVKIV